MQGHLSNLCALVGLQHLEEDCRSCYEVGYFGANASQMLSESTKMCLKSLRPQIINLVESIKLPDSLLVSAIGNSYGDIYETHLKWAKENKCNQGKGAIPMGFMENIMPILKGKL